MVKAISMAGLLPTNGASPISNETVAVRGVAKKGPMVRYTAMARTRPAMRPMGLVKVSRPPPTRASATTPSSGRPTPVSKKPAEAPSRFSPAAMPTMGGKMMLPAPRKRAKVMKPRARMSRVLSVVIAIGSGAPPCRGAPWSSWNQGKLRILSIEFWPRRGWRVGRRSCHCAGVGKWQEIWLAMPARCRAGMLFYIGDG